MRITSDGNGGYNISKSGIAFWALVVLIIGLTIPFVFGYSEMKTQVHYNTEELNEMDELKDDIHNLEKAFITCTDNLESIKEDISEIKIDVKEIRKQS